MRAMRSLLFGDKRWVAVMRSPLTHLRAVTLLVFGIVAPVLASDRLGPALDAEGWQIDSSSSRPPLGTQAVPLADAESVAAGPLAEREAAQRDVETKFRALSAERRAELLKQIQTVKQEISKTELSTYFHAIQFLTPAVGWAMDWNGLLHGTVDGGRTWKEERLPLGGGVIGWLSKRFNVPPPKDAPFRNMHFADDSFGVIVGGTGVLQTEDGGKTWYEVSSPPTSSNAQQHAVFCNPDRTCWFSGELNAIFRRNPDSTWSRQAIPVSDPINAIQFISPSIGWARTPWDLIGTTDGGQHWRVLFQGRPERLWAFHFIDEHQGWAVGADALVMHTEDGGATWVRQQLPVPPRVAKEQVRLHAVKFIDAQRGWAAGLHGMIFATTDGGATWKLQRLEGYPANWLTIYSLAISEGPTIWAAGNSGGIYASTDGGNFWFAVHGVPRQLVDALRRLIDHPGT